MPRKFETDEEYLLSLSNDKYDPELGHRVGTALYSAGLETPQVARTYYDIAKAVRTASEGIMGTMMALGLDMADPSLKDTPRRFAHMLVGDLTWGLNYNLFPRCTTFPKIDDELIVCKDVEVLSLCEHHLQTIDGYAHIGYIPKDKALGLSKFARITEFFCRRPQVQERLTAQIFTALKFILDTDDIAVVIHATHYCMKARGALQHKSTTHTNRMGGRFMNNPALRQEFLDGTRR